VLLMALAWFTWLRPTSLGGDAAYVIVQGRSMEPTYEDGDLVLVREQSSYSEGDVIAFRAGGTFEDPTRIIHRIVGQTGDGAFLTQGDNRDQLDPWEPTPDDIIGRAVLHVPMIGQAAGFLTNPATFAALGGAAVVVGGEKRRRRRRSGPAATHTRTEATMPKQMATGAGQAAPSRLGRMTHPRWAFLGLVASVVLALPVLAVTWSALRAPDSAQRVEVLGAVESGISIDYRFIGSASAVYPEGVVEASRNAAGAVTPDGPLYSRLLDRLDIDLGFRVDGQGARRLDGSYGVDVTIETPSGWSTRIDAIDPKPFGTAATEALSIDLRAAALRVAAVAELTGVAGDAYTLRVSPSLVVTGASAAGEVDERLAAPMTFEVEGNVITPNVLETSDRSELRRTVAQRATYSIGPLEMGTQAARGLLGGLTLVLVAGIAWFASVLFGGLGLGEPARIAARYRSQIVDVSAAAAPPGPVVMVSAIDELARIAKVEQTVIVHEDLGDGAHRYRVFLGTVTYEFETAPEHAGAASQLASDSGETGG